LVKYFSVIVVRVGTERRPCRPAVLLRHSLINLLYIHNGMETVKFESWLVGWLVDWLVS